MVFITGYSGRFPDAKNIPELKSKLLGKEDLVSLSKRYPLGYHGLPDRAGHLIEINKFDSKFFKLNKLHVEGMDPQIRMLLEVVYEAIVDSGSSISSLKGSKTGVYVGHCFSDYHNGIISNINNVNGYENVGSANSMAANKISFFFDFHGPSFTVDTACSSSLVALDRACNDLSAGLVDHAIVAGVSLNLRPTISKVFQKYNMLSPTGTCHSFDAAADGYCRSETIGALFLQSSASFPLGKTPGGYCEIVGHGTNTNGSTPQGITYPCVIQQANLINDVCSRFNIDKRSVGYIETHGTGTTAGDNVEITALDNAYGSDDATIPIGSVKSNLGHAEGASAISSVIKCLLMYEMGCTLANLHFDPNNLIHEPLRNKRFKVVTESEPFDTSRLIAINNFGFGGVNAHVILRKGGIVFDSNSQRRTDASIVATNQPYFVYDRTAENVAAVLSSTQPSEFCLRHLDDIDRYPFRGVMSAVNASPLVNKVSDAPNRPVVFIYSGQGSQHKHMAKSLFNTNDVFHQTILRVSQFLSSISSNAVDMVQLFSDGELWDDKMYSSIGITAVQLALTNMLKEHDCIPQYVIGHSMGEIACAYADDCLTESQCIHIAYIRSQLVALLDPNTFIYIFSQPIENGKSSKGTYELINQYDGKYTYRVSKCHRDDFEREHSDFNQFFDNHGAMLFVSLLVETAGELLLSLECKYTTIACYNSLDGQTLSGPLPEIQRITEYCREHSIFHRAVETGGIAYHSPLLAPYEKYLIGQLEKVIPPGEAKMRTSRWLSTSDITNKLCDAVYHTKNITGSVLFYQAVQQLPQTDGSTHCLLVEVGPHNGLIGQVKRTRPDFETLLYCMSQKEPQGEVSFAKLIDSLWLNGCNVHHTPRHSRQPAEIKLSVDDRYRVPWDHDEVWKIVTYKDFEGGASSSNKMGHKISYDLALGYEFLLDHVIQSQPLFPAMGHVYTMWQVIGLSKNIQLLKFQIFRAINIGNATVVEFDVYYDQGTTNKMDIYHAGELVASAVVTTTAAALSGSTISSLSTETQSDFVSSKDIYSQFNRYGYNYADKFQVIDFQSIDGSLTVLKSVDFMHWINFLDGMLQCSIGSAKCLKLPTQIASIQLNPCTDFPTTIIVESKCVSQHIRSDVALIIDLEVTPAPLSVLSSDSGSVVHSIKFVPYGENRVSSMQVDLYKTLFIRFCHQQLNKMITNEVLIKYPHLANLKRYIVAAACKTEKDSAVNNLLLFDQQPVYAITKDIYSNPDLLVNPLLTLSQHPLHNDLYLKDILFSSSPDALKMCIDIIHENMDHKYRFLEIGTGTGGALRRVYPLLSGHIESYTASDISVINLDESLSSISSTRWNINDPFPFPDTSSAKTEKYDVIFGSNSVHCAKNMITTLNHISDALNDGGYLLLEEYVSELPIYLWGLDSFIWTTAELECEREHGLWMSNERWMTLFEKANMDLIISFNNDATCLYLLRKRATKSAGQITIASMQNVLDDLSTVVVGDTSIITLDKYYVPAVAETDALVVVAGPENGGVLGFVKSLRKEPDVPRTVMGYLFLDSAGAPPLRVDSLPGVEKSLVTNVVKNGVHGSFRESLDVSGNIASNWTIQIEKPGFLSTLYYKQTPLPSQQRSGSVYEGDVVVSYVGLNFKDVMLSYGKLKLDGPITLGIEFSGVYTPCSGEMSPKRVMGIGMNCLSLKLNKSPLMWELPDTLSLKDAATIPCVYATVLYCLDHCARIQAGQSILIHAGAGGIGQAAINVCLKRGCRVYTTCSSSKRQFLIDKFGLADEQIGNSRDASFKDWILEVTGDMGVDVVLNSLSEDMLLCSLECVAKFGHFCEIGKYDIMNDNKIGLKVFANNITFHGVDISDMIHNPKFNKILTDLVQRGLQNNEVAPIHIDSVYHHRKLDEAIRYMGSGSHKGKILIEMSPSEVETSVTSSSLTEQKTFASGDEVAIRPFYNTRGVHLITGGLGGFGLELADWLLECGAEKVYLLSRSHDAKNGYQKRKIKLSGGRLSVVKCDVTNEKDVEAVFKLCQERGDELVGIWHLSMLLQDALFRKMSQQQWDACVQTKIDAAQYLDTYSKAYAHQLKDFVMFSSISSLYGNGGQTNYAYANACMEVLGLNRHNLGLPAKVICWGRIGNVGYVSNKGKVTTDERVEDQHIDSCLFDLHRILTCSSPVVSCYKPSQSLATDSDASSASGSKASVLGNVLRVLGLDAKKVSDSDSLTDLGVDSLQVVTIKSILKGKGVELAVADIYQMKIGDIQKLN